MISESDISIVLSGGVNNSNPANALGGDPSIYPLNNSLFSNSSILNNVDKTDYRCVYLFNNNTEDPLYNVKVSVSNSTPDDTDILLGSPYITDIQHIIFHGTPTSGNYVIDYDGTSINVPGIGASDLQNALNHCGKLTGTMVSTIVGTAQLTHVVQFRGGDDHRYHPKFEIITNNVSGTSKIVVQKKANGGPVNAIVSSILHDTNPPNNIAFNDSTPTITKLNSGEGFPVWIKRTVYSGQPNNTDQGFDINVEIYYIPHHIARGGVEINGNAKVFGYSKIPIISGGMRIIGSSIIILHDYYFCNGSVNVNSETITILNT